METQTTPSQTPADRAGAVKDESKQAAQNVAGTAGQEAKNVTREASDQVRQLWGQTRSDLTDQAATQQTRVASGLRELADQLGSMASGADSDGMAKGLVDDVARRAGDAASWLDQRDPGSLLEEVRGFARQRPGAFLAIAAGVGVLAGRMSRSLVDEHRDSSDSGSDSYRAGSNGSGTYVSGAQDASTGGHASTDTGFGEGYETTAGGYGTGSLGVTDDLLDAPRTSQPIQPDGTASPIDAEGNLTADPSPRASR